MMRLGLWAKLTAAFVFAALVPVGVTAWIARSVVTKRYEREHKKALKETHALVSQEVQRAVAEVPRKVKNLARDNDPKIGRVLVELARGRLPADLRRELDQEGPERMRHLGFDVLFIADARGKLLSAGHAPGRVGQRDPLPGQLAENLGPDKAAFVVLEVEVQDPGKGGQLRIARRPAIIAARWVRGPGTRVVVAGGLLLDRAVWSRLPKKQGVAYLLKNAKGKVLRQPVGGWKRWSRYPQRKLALVGADGRMAAEILIAIDDEDLVLNRQRLDLTIMALAGSAFLFVLLLVGAVVVRRITRRLSNVAAGAELVADGNLGVTLPPGPRDEVGDLVRAFNKMTYDLREARDRLVQAERIAAWREIARRIAHEIKNPLTPIQLSIETLRRAYEKETANYGEILEESTATILEEVQRLRRIVTEFSQFARLPKPQLAAVDLNDVLTQAVGLHAPGSETPAEEDAERIELELADHLPNVEADREQMMQVLHNLLANAEEAVREVDEPSIRVRSFARNSVVGFQVADNGHGFDLETRRQIFTPYFTTKSEGRGTGLGLAIVHRIVAEHGGTIEADGIAGAGATFTVLLPASTVEVA